MKWQIPYQGRTWEFDDSRLTFSEARMQKRITAGLTPTAADRARHELDPEALIAALVIARKRAGLPVEEAALIDSDIDDELIVGDEAGVADLTVEVAEAVPTPAEDEAAKEVIRAKRTRKVADPV